MTRVMQASQVRQEWSNILNTIYKENSKVIVEKSGIPVAAVISVTDLKRFTQLDEQRKERFKALDSIREAFKNVPVEEVEQEIKKAIDEVREEMLGETPNTQ